MCYLVTTSKNYTFSLEAWLVGQLECEPQLPTAHLSMATPLSAGLDGLRLIALVFTHGLKSGHDPQPAWQGPDVLPAPGQPLFLFG